MRKFYLSLFFSTFVAAATQAQLALVKDLSAGSSGSTINTISASLNGSLYFSADDGSRGKELWKSDGSTGGTVLLKEIHPQGDASPDYLTVLNNTLYFTANDGTGIALWKTDGTESGTVKVSRDVLITSGSGKVVAVGNVIYFSASSTTSPVGTELYKYDITSNTTSLVRDIHTGTGSSGQNNSSPNQLYNFNGTLVFHANDGTNGIELWKSNGTAAGTQLVKDIRTGNLGSTPVNFTTYNGKLFFAANDGTGLELWSSDGSSGQTVRVKDINTTTATASSTPQRFIVYKNLLYFVAIDNANSLRQLWQTDGINTVKVTSAPTDPSDFVVYKDQLFFRGISSNDSELWAFNGTTASLVKDMVTGASSFPTRLQVINNLLYFTINTSTESQLYQSDGSAAGTLPVQDLHPSGDDKAILIGGVNGTVYITATNGSTGPELYALHAPALTGSGTTTLTTQNNAAEATGTQAGWTYYIQNSNVVFGIQWGSATAAKNAARVLLTNDNLIARENTTASYATYAMGRYWNVNTDGLSAENTKVRFYFNPAEKTSVLTAAQTFASTYGVTATPFTWFKTNGTAYDPAEHITAGGVLASLTELTGTETTLNSNLASVQFDNVNGFSGGTGVVSAGLATPLPVELLFFKAEALPTRQVRFSWASSQEKNAASYHVERSRDRIHTIEVGSRPAAGTTQVRQDYAILDEQPPLGTSYYRLRQVDTDGTVHTYRWASVVLTESGLPLSVYPNPSKGNFRVQVDDADLSTVKVISLTGLEWKMSFKKVGSQVLESQEKLPAGSYVIEVSNGVLTQQHKLLVLE